MKSIYSKVYKDIISRMKKARKEAGFTQKDVADKLKVTQPYISKIEACQLRVDIVQLKKFAELYGKPLNYMLDDAPAALALAEEGEGYSASGSGASSLRDPLDSVNFAVRDPLNAVIGLSERLLKTDLNQEQKRFVRDIEASSDELLRQVKEIVDFSRLESGRVQPADMEFDIKETVEQVVRAAQSRAASCGLDVMCFVDPNIPQRLKGDQYFVYEILFNLFASALDMADPGGTVSLCVEKNPEGSALLAKPQEGRPHLQFHVRGFRLEQGSPSGNSSPRAGLGLDVSKALVEKLGGVFWMDSSPAEHGCDFRFSLPLELAEESAPSPQAQVFKGKKVLLVTGNRERRRVFSSLFASWGMESSWAEDAESADKVFSAHGHRPDLLVADCPPADQHCVFCEKLRRHSAQKEIKIVFLTTAAQAAKMDKGEHALVRPACQNMMFECISRVFSMSKGKGESKRHKVLLVEDNPVTAKLIAYMLSESGFALDLTSSGEAAVGAAADKEYDAVVMDLRLPEMDGCAAAERIISEREQAGKKPVPVIGISADDTSEARAASEKSGMSAFIAKPLRAATLSALLKRHIQKARA